MGSENGMLGERLKQWRGSLRLSLGEAARRVDISKGYLSRIENDLASPSIAVLNRISQAYGAPLAQLLDTGGTSKIAVVRSDERLALNRDGTEHGYIYELINHGKADRQTECFVVTLPPSDNPPDLFSHEGEELFFVLSGRVRFVYGGTEVILHKGDSVYFDSAVQHRGLADGGESAMALAVIVPPANREAPERSRAAGTSATPARTEQEREETIDA